MGVITFSHDVPLEESMAFEAVYPAALQLDLSEKQVIWDTPGSVFAWMFVDRELAGECYGFPLACPDERIAGLKEIPDRERQTGIHCYSNTMLPPFQNQGLGTILKAHWLGLAFGKGFDVVYGYARSGASQVLNAKFGAVFLAGFPDWYGTGEEYKLYRLPLKCSP